MPGTKRKRDGVRGNGVEELLWRPVEVNGGGEFEGLLGLEEVEDVDVSYEKSNGLTHASFTKTAAPKAKTKPVKAKSKKAASKGIVQKDTGAVASGFKVLQQSLDLPVSAEWEKLHLSDMILKAIGALKFMAPTPIQVSCIPLILDGRDVIGKASTGSGKTLAYGIPIMEQLLSMQPSNLEKRSTSALVLVPTRELAKQIAEHLTAVSLYTPISIITLTGGLALSKQLRQLAYGVDVVIATPGRLWEVMQQQTKEMVEYFAAIRFLVLDEADRLLQSGHFGELEQILQKLDGSHSASKRQTLVFSATFNKNLQTNLKRKSSSNSEFLNKADSLALLLKRIKFRERPPPFIDVNPDVAVADKVQEGIVECGAMEKDLYLYHFLLRYPGRTLVFVNSIHGVKRIVPLLAELGIQTFGLHSNMIQKARLRTLERFKQSSKSVLIATDVAARGLDISLIQHVIHYHLPRSADMYVHRAGRTARASERGVSILLCCPSEKIGLKKMFAKLDKDLGGMLSFPIERHLLEKVRVRVSLAKRIADSGLATQKTNHEKNWLAEAADDLGVELDEITKM